MDTGTYQFHSNFTAQWEATGYAQTLLRILDRRGIPVDEASRTRILDCHDPEQLRHWIDRALTATSTDDLFAYPHKHRNHQPTLTLAQQIWSDLMNSGTYEYQVNLTAQWKATGTAHALLRILDRRGIPVDEASRTRILDCHDPEQLRHWVDRALTATSTDDLFA